MAPEPDQPQPDVASLLLEAEAHLKSGDIHTALAMLQEADKLYPDAKGVKEALAVAKVMTAVKGGIKRGCKCGGEDRDKECDWYAVLRVDPQADEAAIKRKFKQYALHCHPDKNSSSCADEAFKWVSEANAVLSDPVQRAMYNKKRALLAAPCIDCILKKSTLEESLGARLTSAFPRSGGGRSRSGDYGKAFGGPDSAEEFRGVFVTGESREGICDPVFQQKRGYGAGGGGGEREESWQEKRERWLRQLDKSKAKAQVRKQAWDEGLRASKPPPTTGRVSSPPLRQAPIYPHGYRPTYSDPFTEELIAGVKRPPGPSVVHKPWQGSGVTEKSAKEKATKKVPLGGRFAVDEAPGFGADEVTSRGAGVTSHAKGVTSHGAGLTSRGVKASDTGRKEFEKKVPLTGGLFANLKAEPGAPVEVRLRGGEIAGEGDASLDPPVWEREGSIDGIISRLKEEGPTGRFTNGGVLRQRKDTNRSSKEFGEGVMKGADCEKGWSKDLPPPRFGGEYGKMFEKENLGDVQGRALFPEHRNGNPHVRTEPSPRSETGQAPTSYEQLMSTLRRMKKDGVGGGTNGTNGKKVGLSFGAASTFSMKVGGYDAFPSRGSGEACGIDRSAGEELLDKLRRLRMDDGKVVMI